jgi:AmmeMemoRadiSam system protein A
VVSLAVSYAGADEHYALGVAIAKAANRAGRRVAVIASGDLSHRLTPGAPAGFNPRGIDFDAKIGGIIDSGSFNELFELDPMLIEDAGECGLRSIYALAGCFNGLQVQTSINSYEGPFGVGYLVASVLPGQPDPEREFMVLDFGETVDESSARDDETTPPALAELVTHSEIDDTAAVIPETYEPEQVREAEVEALPSERELESNEAEPVRETESVIQNEPELDHSTDPDPVVAEVEVLSSPTNDFSEDAEYTLPAPPDLSEPVRLAKLSLEQYIRVGLVAEPPDNTLQELLDRRAGAFVCIKIDGELRGCIGTIQPTEASVAQEIMANVVQAAQADPRFAPVSEAELPFLQYSVDILDAPERIDSPSHLDPMLYGVIVRKGAKTGLLLPNIEGVDTVEHQLAIAKQKAGIPLQDDTDLYRFKVTRYE